MIDSITLALRCLLLIICMLSSAFGYLHVIHTAETRSKMPSKLLHAVAFVESGRIVNKRKTLWPWTINVQGKGYMFNTKKEAIDAIQRFQAQGIRSIDVGIMQINLRHHPHAFPSLEHALDPACNIAYGAQFLTDLYKKYGSWHDAVRYYHSSNATMNRHYLARVLGVLKTLESSHNALSALATPLVDRYNTSAHPPSIVKDVKGYMRMKHNGTVLSDEAPSQESSPKALPITVSFFPLPLQNTFDAPRTMRGQKTTQSSHAKTSVRVMPLAPFESGVMPLH